MSSPLLSLGARLLWGIPLMFAALAAASAQDRNPTEPNAEPGRGIRLAVEKIPLPARPLTVLRLTPQKAPTKIVEEILREGSKEPVRLGPLARIPQLAGGAAKPPEDILAVVREGSLAAYVNVRTGDAEVFPSLIQERAVSSAQEAAQLERAESRARQIFGRTEVLPRDATTYTLEKPRPVYGEAAEHSGQTQAAAKDTQLYLVYVAVHHAVGEHYVYGPDSRALVARGSWCLATGIPAALQNG